RDRLTAGMFISADENDPIAVLEAALAAAVAAEPVEQKLRAARSRGADRRRPVAAGLISAQESQLRERARELRRKAIMVDDFPQDLGKPEIHQTTQPVTFEALEKVRPG